MIIFLDHQPEKQETILSTDCMTNEQHTRTVTASGSQTIDKERRYWVTMADNETGEIITCEYELVDNMIPV